MLDEKGRPQAGAEAAEIWRRQYERIGTERDDADERIQAGIRLTRRSGLMLSAKWLSNCAI